MNDIYVPILSEGKAQLYLVEVGFQTAESAVFSICNRIKGQGNEGIDTLIDKIGSYCKDSKRISLTLRGVVSNKVLKPNEITLNTQSIALGLLIKVIIQNENRQVYKQYDKIVITGNFLEDRLVEINDVIEKYNAIPKNNSEKILFVYISDKLENLEYVNNVTIKRFNTKDNHLSDVINYIFAPVVEYYENWIDKNGIPFGIGKISKEQVKERVESYRFEYIDNKLVRVVHINSNDLPYNFSYSFDCPLIQVIEVQTEDTIIISCRNEMNTKLYLKEYSLDENLEFNRLKFKQPSNTALFAHNTDSMNRLRQFTNNENRAAVRGYLLSRNENGFVTRKLFLRTPDSDDLEDGIQVDENGLSGEEYQLYEDGRPHYEYYLNKRQDRVEKKGIYCNEFIYTNQKTIVNARNHRNQIIYTIEQYLDKYKNQIGHAFFEKNKKPAFESLSKFSPDMRYHKCSYNIEKGKIIEEVYFNIKSEILKESLKQLNTAKIKRVYDDYGIDIKESYYINDKPFINSDGYISIETKYENELSQLKITKSFLGGKVQEGMIVTNTFNSKGLSIKKEYYDINRNRIKYTDDEIQIRTAEYDCNNRIIKEAYFSEPGIPQKNKAGYTECRLTFDKVSGNCCKIEYYDTKGICDTDYGYASIEYKWNKQNKILEIVYRNKNGVPYKSDTPFPIRRYDYYESPNLYTIKFYRDETEDSSKEITLEFDDLRRVIKEKVYKRRNANLIFDYCFCRNYENNYEISFLNESNEVISIEDAFPNMQLRKKIETVLNKWHSQPHSEALTLSLS